jgi:succinate dehydrogenase / fumarate reductase flavoprotein subunit
VFGQRAGQYAAEFARTHAAARIDDGAIERGTKEALAPFDRRDGENPYKVQQDLQDTMQALVGIVRVEDEMREALTKLDALKARARNVGVLGHREYNSGWHTALDVQNLMIVAEAIALCAIERRESRGGHFREDYPDKNAELGQVNMAVKQTPEARMQVTRTPIPPIPEELKQVIEEQKT